MGRTRIRTGTPTLQRSSGVAGGLAGLGGGGHFSGPWFPSHQDEGWVVSPPTARDRAGPHLTRPAAQAGLCMPFHTSTGLHNTVVSLEFPCP